MRALLLLALTCARADVDSNQNINLRTLQYRRRGIDVTTGDCMYSGRWWAEGALVPVRDACLRCRCAHGALSCARAACAQPPDPPPRRCAVLHRHDTCCPELHCPDGVKSLELSAVARLESETENVVTPASPGHACVEEGAVFAAGSALSARAACEQCFCLRGARRCVRPRCLPPPPGCAPRPAPGACCPQRYYCDPAPLNNTTPANSGLPTAVHRRHDCVFNGIWISEGERVSNSVAGGDNCSQCFCLRGALRCQPLACAPALRGCSPLLRAGHCCPHQYHCPHHASGSLKFENPVISDNSLVSSRNEERSFRTSSSVKHTITTRASPKVVSISHAAASPPTTKVKRKTEDAPPPTTTSRKPTQNKSAEASRMTSVITESPTTLTSPSSFSTITVTSVRMPETTEQPESSVKIIINGTINCTAELSSGFTNTSTDDTASSVDSEVPENAPPRTEAGEVGEAHTASPVDIITERLQFEDSFTVNVSSSLRANTSHAAPPPSPPTAPIASTSSAKEDYDYDYTEPTLPPSLPNLKIIPFVAADAVLEDDASVKRESVSYPALEREDKFPVYYPSLQPDDTVYANRREDVYSPQTYPVFAMEKVQPGLYSELLAAETSKAVTKPLVATTIPDRTLSPSVNLFSPPVETEGGFVPKGPGLIDKYYAVYPSTPPPVPHLTTSMQINPNTPDAGCITNDGERVAEGDSVRTGCSVCTCEWAELSCAPLRCHTPSHCRRASAAAATTAAPHDACCGELICDQDSTTSMPSTSPSTTSKKPSTSIELQSDLIPFDPPPDRSVPEPSSTIPPAITTEPDQTSIVKHVANTTSSISSSTATTQTLLSIKNVQQPPGMSISGKTTPSSVSSYATTPPTNPATSTLPTSLASHNQNVNDSDHHSQEYEDEDDDEGFSFGSVLKLLLSDSYDATTPSAKTKPTTLSQAITSLTTITTTSPPPQTTKKLPPRLPAANGAPLPSYPYIPPKKLFVPNSVNRIDHLVLGEATAIRKSTPRPTTTPFRPVTPPLKRMSTRASTRRPATATPAASPESRSEEPPVPRPAPPSPAAPAAGGGGLFKLAGCNIYGRMYRVGRIIAELSTPCQECRCTELGVQCSPLRC